MRCVGTASFGGDRVAGAAVVTSAGDLTAALRSCARAAGRVLVRLLSAVLRTGSLSTGALLGSARGRSVSAVPGRPAAGAHLAAAASAAPRFVTQHHAGLDAARVPARCHELALPADPTAPRRARGLLQSAAREWEIGEDLHEDGAMVVTELVANAVDHAGTPSTLVLGLDERGLYVAVRDRRPGQAPRPGPVDTSAPRGRGLQMIDALAASWGVTVHTDGKTVWAVLRQA